MNIREAVAYAKERRAEWSEEATVPTDVAVLSQLAEALEAVLELPKYH